MLSEAKHLCADGKRPFAEAQGDTVWQLRLICIRADKSAVGAIMQINNLLRYMELRKRMEGRNSLRPIGINLRKAHQLL
jgi:hypothetical protein